MFRVIQLFVFVFGRIVHRTIRIPLNSLKLGMLISFFPKIDYRFEKIDFFFRLSNLCIAHCPTPLLAE